jgi:hypothetical protein
LTDQIVRFASSLHFTPNGHKGWKKTMERLEIVAGEKQIDTKKAVALGEKKNTATMEESHNKDTRHPLAPQQANKNVKKKKKEEEYNDPT